MSVEITGVLKQYDRDKRKGILKNEEGRVPLYFSEHLPFLRTGLKYKVTGEKIGNGLKVRTINPVLGDLDLKNGLPLFYPISEEKLRTIAEHCEIKQLGELLDEEKLQKAEKILDTKDYELLIDVVGRIKRDEELCNLYNLFKITGASLDISHAARLIDYFQARARWYKTTVCGLICENPYIILQADIYDTIKDGIADAEKILGYFGRAKDDSVILAVTNAIAIDYIRDNSSAYIPMWVLRKRLAGYGYETGPEMLKSWIISGNSRGAGKLVYDKTYEEEMLKEEGYSGKDAYRISAVYPARIFHEERYIAQRIAEILAEPVEVLQGPILQNARKWAKERGIELSEAQEAVVNSVMSSRITVVIGKAGSGKTTALRSIVHALREEEIEVVLLAPTGIAAQRLAAESDIPFSTIHRYARIYDDDDYFIPAETDEEEEENIDVQGEKVIVVDEMSMATIPVIAKLLSTAGKNCRYVFAGDPAQLPPIGAGGIFEALIKAGEHRYNIIELKDSYRQNDELLENALNIREGRPLREGEKLEIVPANKWEKIEAELRKRLKGRKPGEVAVFARRRKDVERLNSILRSMYLDTEENLDDFVPGDIVIATRNDYDTASNVRSRFLRTIRRYRKEGRPTIFNGTRGVVEKVETDVVTVKYTLPNGSEIKAEYDPIELRWYIEHAFAMTVHKAQGGQYKEIIFVEPEPETLAKSMLYTAFTRSTGKVTLLGGKQKEDWNRLREDGIQLSKLYWRIVEALERDKAKINKLAPRKVVLNL
ncbi:ATP-dependent RecD-like DNA helicase [Fervidicola ferrireducens]|uniref:ATP-dependent RecD-like DNA helicase n=1 Tax=Fervidicola ferrireducens TaxID=520764 RepID=A0A140L220_9FIRM|nr:AAA family ATPase [Fervidicola ferrireducens]KXG74595.1 ATP-dependent RecD-like DNA helicase [Fervidicola ferrireducens]